MRATAVIEIAEQADVELPVDLIEAAYRASSSAHVVFIVARGARARVDRVLDPVVMSVGLTPFGVRYLTPDDVGTLQSVVSESSWAVASSPTLRACCSRLGVPLLPPREAIERLLARAPSPVTSMARFPLVAAR